jgi:hypothetical protein
MASQGSSGTDSNQIPKLVIKRVKKAEETVKGGSPTTKKKQVVKSEDKKEVDLQKIKYVTTKLHASTYHC